jgi:hypothetical protein
MSDIFELFGLEDDAPVALPPPKVQPPPKPPKPPKPPPKVAALVEPAPPAQEAPVEPTAPRTPPAGPTMVVRYLDCGHMDWHRAERNEQARAEGLCCANQNLPISWPHLKGAYARPLPKSQHRTAEKDHGFGFPGYCCDAEGWYIGGIGNDCRFYSPDERRCSMHTAAPRQKVGEKIPEPVVEVVEPDDEVTEPDELLDLLSMAPVEKPPPAALPVTGTWKQRQMQRRK